MNQMNALISALVQDPSLLRRMAPALAGYRRLADLSATEAGSLKALADAVSSMLQGVGGRAGYADGKIRPQRRQATNGDARVRSGQGVEVAALVSLLAVTGTLSVLGTVSLVALSCGTDRRPL
jgi:hypothetical protein